VRHFTRIEKVPVKLDFQENQGKTAVQWHLIFERLGGAIPAVFGGASKNSENNVNALFLKP